MASKKSEKSNFPKDGPVDSADILELFARPSESIIGGHVPSEGILAKQNHESQEGTPEKVVCGPIVQSVFGGSAKGGFMRE